MICLPGSKETKFDFKVINLVKDMATRYSNFKVICNIHQVAKEQNWLKNNQLYQRYGHQVAKEQNWLKNNQPYQKYGHQVAKEQNRLKK